MSFLQLEKNNYFSSRNDPKDLRLGDIIAPLTSSNYSNIKENDFVILGYPDDEGIKNNKGRTGAAKGPDEIRKILYKSTPSYLRPQPNRRFFDIGNLDITPPLFERQELALKSLRELHERKAKFVSFGGGHDYAFPDIAAYLDSGVSPQEKVLIVNFDAHLDVRPYNGEVNSGTPFYRLIEAYPDRFDFLEIGLQTQCNSPIHAQWLKNKGGKMIWLDEILSQSEESGIQLLDQFPKDHRSCFISVDLDAFSSAYAPGCSQSWPTGISPNFFWPVYQHLLTSFDVRALGIYECCPPLDSDFRTSRLASKIAHEFLYF